MKLGVKNFLNRVFRRYGYELTKMERRENDFDYKLILKNESPVIFDIGANQGQSIGRFKKMFETPRIYSFEPTPNLAEDMKNNYSNDPNVIVIPKAVSDYSSTVKLNMYKTKEEGVGNSIHALNPSYGEELLGTQIVETTTVDDFCASNNITVIDVLKIDVQGHEPECLKGAIEILKTSGIKVIELEIIFDNTYDRSLTFYDIESILQPYGYKLYAIPVIRRIGLGKYRKVGYGRLSWLDAVYMNEETFKANTINGR